MSRGLTLRWVTRSCETGNYFPGGAGEVSGRVRESAGRMGSTPHRPGVCGLQVTPVLTQAHAQEHRRCQHSSKVPRAPLVTRPCQDARRPVSRCVLGGRQAPPKLSLGASLEPPAVGLVRRSAL